MPPRGCLVLFGSTLVPVRSLLRASVALVLSAGLIGFLGLPVCYSAACPMSGAERAACKAMGRECCGTKGGQLSHGPAVPMPALATPSAGLGLAVPVAPKVSVCLDSAKVIAAPAVLQGVGLFTLFAIFLI